MSRLIIILIDGLSFESAENCFCFVESLVRNGLAKKFSLLSCLPPISRPAYATILTGRSPLEHGILSNDSKKSLSFPTFFSFAIERGCQTAAAAYSWFFELCNNSFWQPDLHRMVDDLASPINHGMFYGSDNYPDEELFADANFLWRKFHPDLLLIHPMGVDFAGHSGSINAYLNACSVMDDLLAKWMPGWLPDAQILMVSDHGMNYRGGHHTLEAATMHIPLWLIGEKWPELTSPTLAAVYPLIVHSLKQINHR